MKELFTHDNQRGFTLIELLIVIAIIAILAAVVFVALDPLTRFQDSRDAVRANDITELLTAIKVDQIDNGGSYLSDVSAMTAGDVYMIGTATSGCDDDNTLCDTNVTADTDCVDLGGLVTEGYMASVPISPDGDTNAAWDAATTGYTLQRDSTGILTVRSCESENTTEIIVAR